MKKLLLGALLLVAFTSNAQIKREKFIEKYAGRVQVLYQRSINIDKEDTMYMVFLVYQNAKYSTIADTKIIGIYQNEELAKLIKDLTTAYNEMSKGEKVELEWSRDKYRLALYNFSNNLYLYEAKGSSGYTMLNKKEIVQMVELLSSIDIGNTNLKEPINISN